MNDPKYYQPQEQSYTTHPLSHATGYSFLNLGHAMKHIYSLKEVNKVGRVENLSMAMAF